MRTELRRVYVDDETQWRYEQLVRGGFDTVDAERLAVSHCDYHDALRLREVCPLPLLLQILTD